MAETRLEMLPLRDFGMQYLVSSYGLPHKSVSSIIGPEHIGKTSLMFYFMGCGLRKKCPCYYQETESKLINKARVLRLLSSNPDIAKKMLSRIHIEQGIHSVRISKDYLEDWVRVQREEMGVPLHIPLIACIDTWSKLMSDKEAMGFFDYAQNMSAVNKKKHKDVGEGSTFEHAKFAQGWCRLLPHWLSKNNVILILGEHQNDKGIQPQTAGFTLPESYVDKRNKKKVGGRAFNQNAAWQLILTPAGVVKYPDKTKAGKRVNCRVDKNSYGPDDREMTWDLYTEHRGDTEDYLDQAFHFEENLCKLFLDKGLFGLKVNNGLYTSADLGLTSASAEEVYMRFHSDQELMLRTGKLLNIEGYFNLIDEIKENAEKKQNLEDADTGEVDAESVASTEG